MIVIRPCRVAECRAVLALWQRAGAIPSPTDTLVELEQLIAHQGDGLLVAVEDGVIVGSVIGGWDGWRGNIYRLAVAPEARRHGLARRLVDDAVRVLRARGAHRISALVERHALAGDQKPVRFSRLTASRLLPPGRVMDFRRVHADVADLLHALTDLYVDRVAVDDPHDGPLEWSGRRGWRREEQKGQQEQRAQQHAVTVSPTLPRCQQMETLRAPSKLNAHGNSGRNPAERRAYRPSLPGASRSRASATGCRRRAAGADRWLGGRRRPSRWRRPESAPGVSGGREDSGDPGTPRRFPLMRTAARGTGR